MENNPNPLLQSIVPGIKAILDRIAQAKTDPGEVQKAVDEGKTELDKLGRQDSEQGQSRR